MAARRSLEVGQRSERVRDPIVHEHIGRYRMHGRSEGMKHYPEYIAWQWTGESLLAASSAAVRKPIHPNTAHHTGRVDQCRLTTR